MGSRKAAVGIAVTAAAVLGLALPASALDCHNVSRNVSPADYTIATTTAPLISIDLGPGPVGEIVWNVIPDLKGNWYLIDLTENSGVVDVPNSGGIVADPGIVLQTDAVWWGFLPPGTVPIAPGANGNYTNGQVEDLLGMAACAQARQFVHGIQSGACGGIASAFG